jgi:DNA-binding PadR family transcriptional regulator
MRNASSLGEFEYLVLLAILRLKDSAYGVAIRSEICLRTGRQISPGALYTTLDRLETKGFVSSRTGEASPQRGGRPKRYYVVSDCGLAAVTEASKAFANMLQGLGLHPGDVHG